MEKNIRNIVKNGRESYYINIPKEIMRELGCPSAPSEASLSMFYTYVLQSQIDENLYVGHTSDLTQRMLEYNEGRIDSMRTHRHFDMIYYEACHHTVDAVAREKYFKTGFGRRFLQNHLEKFRLDSR